MHVLSVCSGVGGLDLGLRAAMPNARTVCYIEREAFAAAVLAARMEDGGLDPAPIWDDVCTFDARPWRGLVDLVAGGTPCQDLSLAGKRAGLDGDRSRLFFEHVRIAVECESPFFFWENVAGATRVVPRVVEHLEARGYRCVWGTLKASDVRAPHQRARVFLLAYAARFAQREPHHDERPESRQRARGDAGGNSVRLDAAEPVADCHGPRQRQPGGAVSNERRWASDGSAQVRGEPLAHSQRPGLEERGRLPGDPRQELAASFRGRDGLGTFPPGRADLEGWARVLAIRPDLAPALPQPRVRGVAHGVAGAVDQSLRTDRLRACGNGVVDLQAAHAWSQLWVALFP